MKVAVSVPDPIFDAAEHLVRELRVSRSQLYSQALAAYLATCGVAAITARLNAVHANESAHIDHALAQAQLRVLDHETW